jgi:hypothetical protein
MYKSPSLYTHLSSHLSSTLFAPLQTIKEDVKCNKHAEQKDDSIILPEYNERHLYISIHDSETESLRLAKENKLDMLRRSHHNKKFWNLLYDIRECKNNTETLTITHMCNKKPMFLKIIKTLYIHTQDNVRMEQLIFEPIIITTEILPFNITCAGTNLPKIILERNIPIEFVHRDRRFRSVISDGDYIIRASVARPSNTVHLNKSNKWHLNVFFYNIILFKMLYNIDNNKIYL